MKPVSNTGHTRRTFLQAGAVAATGMIAATGPGCSVARRLGPAPAKRFSAPPIDRVRIGFVGVGGMGTNHLKNLLKIDGAEIRAVCDIVEEKVANAQLLTRQAGQRKPTGYSRGEYDFVRMCETEDLDLVYTATPWRWHVPVLLAALENGKHGATEIPAAITIEDCWRLVETAEKTKLHCVIMENCCYGRSELMVLNMVRRGILGEILHCEGGYLHDLRPIKFSSEGEGLWRLDHSISRNGNLYPMHGLGPVAQWLNINRGDRMEALVSLSSPSRGLAEYAAGEFGASDPRATRSYALGDVNTSMIRTALGKTITLVHDTNLPRPYSRINLAQGTKGIFSGYPDRVHIEGRSPAHTWEDAEVYSDEFDHPLWTAIQEQAAGAGHGGMDFIEDYRLIQCLREGVPTDIDVYDAAAWSAVMEASERSVAGGGAPVDIPDFTRGRWKEYPPLGIISQI
jgi:hypothetical protein